MLALCVTLSLLFLLWMFLLTIATHSLTHLGETLSRSAFHQTRFFYLPLHRVLFKLKNFDLLIFISNLGENLARVGFALTLFYCLIHLQGETLTSLIVSIIVVFCVIFIMGDFLPRLISRRAPEKALLFTLSSSSLFFYLTLPFAFPFLKITEFLMKQESKGSHPIEEMKETVVEILQSANIKGKLNTADKKLIQSVIKFKDRIVREVMVPRVDLFCLPSTTTIKDAGHLLAKEGYSRTPVYQGTIDNIVGMLMYKDILEIYLDCESGKKPWTFLDRTIEASAKTVFYTPETKRVSQLLQEFRGKQIHMAIVVDEYGGTAGVVTIEDILEEIVGEIADEYDVDEETLYITQAGGKTWIVDARMNIKDAEDTFGIQIPQEGDYETIGGYLFHHLGSIPAKGLILHQEDFDIEILNSTERSVEKVRISLNHPTKMD